MGIEQQAKQLANLNLSTHEPEDGAEVLDQAHAFLRRFVAYPDQHCHVAHTLWIVHTHVMDAWESTPRLAFLSPEPGSGKTRALEITETLVPRPVEAVNVTPAYLFRKVGDEDGAPTILYDEIDTVFGPKAKDNEEIRGLLNAGHRRGAVAGRCVVKGKAVTTEEIPAYCAVALAGLGGLPDTILTRSVVIRMRRRKHGERVEAYRRRIHASEGEAIRDRLAAWAANSSQELINAWPELPAGIEDRDADLWEPLIAISDAAGGNWPQIARQAAVTLVTASKESTPSLGVRLLSDLRNLFGDRTAMFTEEILEALNSNVELPWGNLRGQPMDARRLASMLRKYITIPEADKSKTVRIGDRTAKGYKAEWLHDPWERYLPPASGEPVTSVTTVTESSENTPNVTHVTDVTDIREPNLEDEMPTRSEIFAAAKEVCTEIDLDPSELTDFIVARGDPIEARPVGIRAWALRIAKEGYQA